MDENQSPQKKDNFLAMSIVVAAILIAGAVVYSAGRGEIRNQRASLTAGEPKASINPADLLDDDVILGDPNAPVTLVEFGDYQCPFCGRFYTQVEPRLRQEYIKTGKVKMVYRDFPISSIHPVAQTVAEASECARDQGKYWIYHDALFERQSELETLDLTALAGQLGLDTQQFRQCHQSGKYAAEVEKDYQDGLAAGVNGTPATFINGKLISGAQPYSVFKAAIDKALAGE